MQDLNDKVTGGTLTAVEWNEVPSEIQNVIEGLGITLSSGDLNQLGKAIAGYVANGNFYTDSGAADAYVLSVIGSKQSLTAYTDGDTFEFIAVNPNTGASTVNVAALGVKNIKLRDGTDPTAGQIAGRTIVKFDSANDRCELIQSGMTNAVIFTTSGTYTPPAGLKSFRVTATGAGGGGGGVDGQGAGTATQSGSGAAGATAILTTDNIAASYTVTIGAGGAGGAVGNNNGVVGGTTTFVGGSVNLSCVGGGPGTGSIGTAGDGFAAGPVGGLATGGDLNLQGGGVASISVLQGGPAGTPSGGDSVWGGGAHGVTGSTGVTATNPGTGGGGTNNQGTADDLAGGAGANGIVVIEEFF